MRVEVEAVLSEYEPLLKAPSVADLERRAHELNVPVEQLAQDEAVRRYKVAHEDGIYLVQNPAVGAFLRDSNGQVIRLKPRLVMRWDGSAAEARQAPASRGGWEE